MLFFLPMFQTAKPSLVNDTAAELAKLFGGHMPPKLPDKPKAKEAKARKVKAVRPREPQPIITKTKEEEDIDELEKDSMCLFAVSFCICFLTFLS